MAKTATVPSLTKRQLRSLYTQWRKGRSKFDIEREELGVTTGRGKTITRLWDRVGLDTVNVSR